MHSVAALLPPVLASGLRVVVAGRPDPPLPDDVEPDHPLRDRAVVRPLSTSPRALARRKKMERDLRRMLAGSDIERDLLGLLTASGGGLTADDLTALVGASRREVDDCLATVAGRSFTRRPSRLAPGTAPDSTCSGTKSCPWPRRRCSARRCPPTGTGWTGGPSSTTLACQLTGIPAE